MTIRKGFAAILIASTVMSGVAYAADSAANTQAPAAVKQDAKLNKAIDKDVGKLSKDGAQALQDIQATRIAIFNAEPDQAKSLIHKAKEEMQKAGKDDSVFMKAVSELTPAKKADPGDKAAATKADDKTPIAWLPVDSQIALGEDFQATPEKMAAVADANKSLKNEDRKGALEKLALANVDVKFTTAVLPLEQTTNDVNKAADLIDQGKFYEANAALKDITDHAMLNIVDVYGQPYKAKPAKAADAKTPAKPAAASDDAKAAPTPAK
ncbi:YfdX protein [Ensifer adhaerens]|nr:YfdX protein [Ensifer adhaerens]